MCSEVLCHVSTASSLWIACSALKEAAHSRQLQQQKKVIDQTHQLTKRIFVARNTRKRSASASSTYTTICSNSNAFTNYYCMHRNCFGLVKFTHCCFDLMLKRLATYSNQWVSVSVTTIITRMIMLFAKYNKNYY